MFIFVQLLCFSCPRALRYSNSVTAPEKANKQRSISEDCEDFSNLVKYRLENAKAKGGKFN